MAQEMENLAASTEHCLFSCLRKPVNPQETGRFVMVCSPITLKS